MNSCRDWVLYQYKYWYWEEKEIENQTISLTNELHLSLFWSRTGKSFINYLLIESTLRSPLFYHWNSQAIEWQIKFTAKCLVTHVWLWKWWNIKNCSMYFFETIIIISQPQISWCLLNIDYAKINLNFVYLHITNWYFFSFTFFSFFFCCNRYVYNCLERNN